MLISIIIPIYNVEEYLEQCLDSVLKQTYKKLEIILVDDGSTDSSGKICDKYANKYNNIITIHKKNEGLGMARNSGLEIATGKLVTFIDSDDYVSETYIDDMYCCLKKSNADMCKSGFKRVTNKGKIISKTNYTNHTYIADDTKRELLPKMIGSRPDIKDSIEMCVCGTLYKVSIIRKHSLSFPSEQELICEDLIFNIDYLQYTNIACTISNCNYYYRYNGKSLTKKYNKDRFEKCCVLYKWVEQKLNQLEYDDMTMMRLRRMFFIHIRMCISQEKKKISHLKISNSLSNIKKICKSTCTCQAIKDYPINQLGTIQKIFIYMVKFQMSIPLYFCANLGLL